MHIVVCVKQVPNPEAAFSMFKVDEAAKRIREAHANTRITVISLGPESARNAIKHGLAMGADDGVLISDPLLENADGVVTARVLATAIQKLGEVDLVLAGRQSADRD